MGLLWIVHSTQMVIQFHLTIYSFRKEIIYDYTLQSHPDEFGFPYESGAS